MAQPKTARVISTRELTETVREVRFRMIDPVELGYESGKYVILTTSVMKEDGKPVKRAYSIASPPDDQAEFSICVKKIPDGPGSGYIHSIRIGDTVTFSGPWGKFFLPDPLQPAARFVFVASGAGISAVYGHLSILARLASWRGAASLCWGLRRMSELYWREELSALKSQSGGRIGAEVFFSDEPGGKLLSESYRDGDIAVDPAAHYYLAGNGRMIEPVAEKLKASGVPEEKILKEIYFN